MHIIEERPRLADRPAPLLRYRPLREYVAQLLFLDGSMTPQRHG